MSDLHIKAVPKCLDKKLEILGFEIFDLIVVAFLLAFSNFLFGNADNSLLLVWGPTIAFALLLRFSKLGRPEHFLIHLLKSLFQSSNVSAFEEGRGENLLHFKRQLKTKLNKGAFA